MTIYNWREADHICYVDCKPVTRESDGAQVGHMMYPASPTTAAGRYQYDANRAIYRMGKGARAAMRASGQDDTRTNREWNLARKMFKDSSAEFDGTAKSDAKYRDAANRLFGPDRRPYIKRSIRSRARAARLHHRGNLAMISRPAYLVNSEHDPNL